MASAWEARSSSAYVRVVAPVSTATASGTARNRSTNRLTSVAVRASGPRSASRTGSGVGASGPAAGVRSDVPGSGRVAGSAGASGRTSAVSTAWKSRSRRSTVAGAKSRVGKFHEKRSTDSSCQHSRLRRVAAVAVPAAVGRTPTGHRPSSSTGNREKLNPAGDTVRGPAPDGSAGSSRARSRPVRLAWRSLSNQIPASRSARASTGSSGPVEQIRGNESASGPTSRSRPVPRWSRRARATFTAMSRCPLHRARQRTCTARSRWNRLTPRAAARRSNAAVSTGSREL